jgi:hypothetical protein
MKGDSEPSVAEQSMLLSPQCMEKARAAQHCREEELLGSSFDIPLAVVENYEA